MVGSPQDKLVKNLGMQKSPKALGKLSPCCLIFDRQNHRDVLESVGGWIFKDPGSLVSAQRSCVQEAHHTRIYYLPSRGHKDGETNIPEEEHE